ncbi:MAG TPA: hypothetical protein VIH37_05825 [Candidatus Limnocylindrales bacterium]
MSILWREAQRLPAVSRPSVRRWPALLVVLLMAVAGIAGATPAAADSATYADPAGDVVNSDGTVNTASAGDIVAYRVTLDAVTLRVDVATVQPLTDLVPKLAPGGDNDYAEILLDTTGDGQPDYVAETVSGGVWDIRDANTGELTCEVPLYGGGTNNVFVFWPRVSCVGSPTHVGVQVLLVIDGAADIAPDGIAPQIPGVGSGPNTELSEEPRAVVYRFWSPGYGNAHFYTTNSLEAMSLIVGDPHWTFEGLAFSALPADGDQCPKGSAMYRFWSPVFSSHFYTMSVSEKDHIVAADRNWQYEGVAYCAYATQQPGTVPLYRFWSPSFGKHFFTADQVEADHIRAVDQNWQYEDVAAYIIPEA